MVLPRSAVGKEGAARPGSSLLNDAFESASDGADFSGGLVIAIYSTDASPKLSVEKS